MKKIYIISCIILVLITGCTHQKRIDHEDYIAFLDDIEVRYEYIDDYNISFWGGPDQLNFDLDVNENLTIELVEDCFEDIKEFLLGDGTRKGQADWTFKRTIVKTREIT